MIVVTTMYEPAGTFSNLNRPSPDARVLRVALLIAGSNSGALFTSAVTRVSQSRVCGTFGTRYTVLPAPYFTSPPTVFRKAWPSTVAVPVDSAHTTVAGSSATSGVG